jgi:hypothetical protein
LKYFIIDTDKTLLTIKKDKNGAINELANLDDLRWIDSSLTDKLKPGYGQVFDPLTGGGDILLMGDRLLPVAEFRFPVVLGFQEGNIIFLWLQDEAMVSNVVTALDYIL